MIVRGYVPAAIDVVVVILSVDVPGALTLAGVKLQVACDEVSPDRVSATAPVKPFTAPTLTVYETVPPGDVVVEDGEVATLKSGGGATTRFTAAVCVTEPLWPIRLSGYVPGASVLAVATVSVEEPLLPVTLAGANVHPA